MHASTYLRDAARMVKSPLTVRCSPDGRWFRIMDAPAALVWYRGDAESALATYKELRRNYLALFRTQD